MSHNQTLPHGERWILAVRVHVTDANPKINVQKLLDIFDAAGEPLDLLYRAYEDLHSPKEAFDLLIAKYGKSIIGLKK